MSSRKEGDPQPPAVFISHRFRPDIMKIISRPPQSWIRDSLPQIKSRIPKNGNEEDFRLRSEQQWKEVSGYEAKGSKLAIVVPIHNEEQSLANFFEVFATQNLPDSAEVRIFFATNACSDKSRMMVEQYLNRLGNPRVEHLPKVERDPQLSSTALTVARGNMRFTHLNTEKAGKANVLSVVNDIATAEGYKIVINMDANNYPQPDTAANLYGNARKNFEEDSKVVLVWGRHRSTIRPASERGLRGLLKRAPGELPLKDVRSSMPNGCLFAWDADWVKNLEKFNGGFPEMATEDRATSVAIRAEGFAMEVAHGAISHGFAVNNRIDELIAGARYYRGGIQIREIDPEYARIYDYDKPELADKFRTRLYRMRMRILKGKVDWKKGLFRLAFTEAMILKAKYDHKKDPKNQSWDKIGSTA